MKERKLNRKKLPDFSKPAPKEKVTTENESKLEGFAKELNMEKPIIEEIVNKLKTVVTLDDDSLDKKEGLTPQPPGVSNSIAESNSYTKATGGIEPILIEPVSQPSFSTISVENITYGGESVYVTGVDLSALAAKSGVSLSSFSAGFEDQELGAGLIIQPEATLTDQKNKVHIDGDSDPGAILENFGNINPLASIGGEIQIEHEKLGEGLQALAIASGISMDEFDEQQKAQLRVESDVLEGAAYDVFSPLSQVSAISISGLFDGEKEMASVGIETLGEGKYFEDGTIINPAEALSDQKNKVYIHGDSDPGAVLENFGKQDVDAIFGKRKQIKYDLSGNNLAALAQASAISIGSLYEEQKKQVEIKLRAQVDDRAEKKEVTHGSSQITNKDKDISTNKVEIIQKYKELEVLAENGDTKAMCKLGAMFIQESIGHIRAIYLIQLGIDWYKEAIKRGEPLAMYQLGIIYQEGKLVAPKYELSLKYFKRLKELNRIEANYRLGQLYFFGLGTERNIPEAKKYFGSVAGNDLLNASYYLGLIAEEQKDFVAAMNLYNNLATKYHNPGAFVRLGLFLEKGLGGISPNKSCAFSYYKYASAKNYPEGIYHHARLCCEEFPGHQKDIDRGISLFHHAGLLGNRQAQVLLAENPNSYEFNDEQKNISEFWKNFLCTDKDTSNLCVLARFFLEGKIVQRSITTGVQYYVSAAQKDNPQACAELGLIYRDGLYQRDQEAGQIVYKIKKDPKEARKLFKKGANLGSADAMYYYAGMLYKDNMDDALEWDQKAAKQGNISAMFRLGSLSLEINKNQLLEKVNEKSMLILINGEGWLEKAADKGDSKTKYDVGMIYINLGKDEESIKAGLAWLKKAANKGDSKTKYDVGMVYINLGQDEESVKKGLDWLKEAVNGYPQAMFMLGHLYREGKKVPLDKRKAGRWYMQAYKEGYKDAMFYVKLCVKK